MQVSFQAETDCNMLRINKSNVHNITQKKVIELERERNKKYKEYSKLIEEPHQNAKL